MAGCSQPHHQTCYLNLTVSNIAGQLPTHYHVATHNAHALHQRQHTHTCWLHASSLHVMYVYVCMYVCMYVFMYVCMYIRICLCGYGLPRAALFRCVEHVCGFVTLRCGWVCGWEPLLRPRVHKHCRLLPVLLPIGLLPPWKPQDLQR